MPAPGPAQLLEALSVLRAQGQKSQEGHWQQGVACLLQAEAWLPRHQCRWAGGGGHRAWTQDQAASTLLTECPLVLPHVTGAIGIFFLETRKARRSMVQLLVPDRNATMGLSPDSSPFASSAHGRLAPSRR